jgi:tRNA(His) guanylyltransferase
MSFNDFDKRMKEYEHKDRQFLPESPYYIIRLDGKAFHTYTKHFKDKTCTDPFSTELRNAFVIGSIVLGAQVEGAMAVYTQSDEVSILVKGYEGDPSRTPWYGGNIQKWVSVSSSILTAVFNYEMDGYANSLAFFDSRVFAIPEHEVNNYFVWRQKDAIRNSVSMYAQHNFSHKSLHGVDTEGQKERLREKGLAWENLDDWKKRGSLVVNAKKLIDTEWTDKKGVVHIEKDVERSEWKCVNTVQFTEENILDVIKGYKSKNSI